MAKIRDIRCIRTRADGSWVIVKVLTDQPGLYGIGSASDYYHASTVIAAIEGVITRRLIGREVDRIEDIWQSTYTSGFWRNGPILNTALGGIDMALWDIKGKEAGMPLYQLLGGPCRSAVACYAHAVGDDLDTLVEDIQRYMEEGYPVIRWLPVRGLRRGRLHRGGQGPAPQKCLVPTARLRRRSLLGDHSQDVRASAGKVGIWP